MLAGCTGVLPDGGPGSAASGTGAPATVTGAPATGSSPDAPARSEAVGTADTPATSAHTSGATCDDPPCYGDLVSLGDVPVEVAPEVSGIAASTRPGYYFVVDDGTGTTSIEVLRGVEPVGRVEVGGMSASNAEALSAGVCAPGAPDRCLYIGDIGDHIGRDSVTVYRIPEPDPENLPSTPFPAQAWTYTYADGPRDAEALMVADDGSLIVIDKPEGGGKHRVYRGAPGGGVFTPVTSFDLPSPTRPLQSLLVGNVVTDAARRADSVLLLTYDQAIEYTAPHQGADPAGFPDWPHRQVPMPRQLQSEAVSYLPGCGYVVASEGGPIAEVNCT
ncbi:hypothetical protein D1871_19820 [Nakamurella silvestris]|nr:hypothetical protein D1871_19820 [Nakamurella silvestris]